MKKGLMFCFVFILIFLMFLTSAKICDDTDGGKNYFESGVIHTLNDGDWKDICSDETTLKERYCLGDEKGSELVFCYYGCKDRKCNIKPLACTDTDIKDSGNGFNHIKKGVVTYEYSTGEEIKKETYVDYCEEGIENSLVEYFCEDNKVKEDVIDCGSGCLDGACLVEKIVTDKKEGFWSKFTNWFKKLFYREDKLKDCGEDFNCLIEASEDCSSASVSHEVTTNIFGVEQITTSYYEIKGVEEEKCIFSYRTENVELSFPEGTSQEVIDKNEQAYKSIIGTGQTCKFETSDLTEMLERWEEGQISSRDWDVAECIIS